MANKVIKGLTVEIGGDTTKLGKALNDVEKKSRDLSSELGSINKLLKLDPSNVELLAQKQKVLSDAISNTEDRLDKLKEAERQVQAQFEKGEASEEQVRALQREIIATTNKLESYGRAAKETASTISKLSDNTDIAAREMMDLGKQEEEAEKNAEDLGDTLDLSLGTALKTVTALAAAASAAIVGAVESTQEYRTEMGKLDAAYQSSGHSSETATAAYKELVSVIGETDQSVEAAQQIALLADSEQEVAKWSKLAAGVVGKFGDALQPETFYEAANETLKLGEATGAYTQMLEGVGLNVEEFNEGLGECNTTSQKQAYILRVAERALGTARDEYKRTNRAVIEANMATEEWNAALADIGEDMQPVVTSIKRMGAEVLASAKEPLANVSEYIMQKVIPTLSSLSQWVLTNGPLIKGTITTTVTVFAAYKAATVAATVAQQGLKGAIMATAAAEKALQLIQAATPWGIAAVAITGVVTALALYASNAEKATEKVDILTEEERELMAAADEAAQSLRDQQAATTEAENGIMSQMGHVQSLANELRGLADASGRVQEKDQARAQFILNELNEALGTEYDMTFGVIQKYQELRYTIDQVIQAKTANALLEANNAAYVQAIQQENEALQNLVLAEKDYQNQIAVTKEAEEIAAAARAELQEKMLAAKSDYELQALGIENQRVTHLEETAREEKALLDEKEQKYKKVATNYGNHSTTIMNYEDAQQAVLEENYTKAVQILTKKSGSFGQYADNVDEATREAIDALYKEAIDAGLAAERTKRNFEKGVDGYTEEMVREAGKGYADALNEWATAKADAESVGSDLSSGLSSGMESKKAGLIQKARGIVSSIISAFREEADSHSPSRKMISFGEDMGEGTAIGLENKTRRLDDVARDQMDGLLGTYSEAGDVQGQRVFQAIQGQNSARQMQSYQAATGSTADKLDKILEAIERGQVLTIDGNQLVGATASRLDNSLGQRRALVARGAL